MKKARNEGGIAGKTADIMSMIKNFVTKSDDKAQSGEAAAKPDFGGITNAAQTPVYQCNVYANLIEMHDKKVKNILKNLEKEKAKPRPVRKKSSAKKAGIEDISGRNADNKEIINDTDNKKTPNGGKSGTGGDT